MKHILLESKLNSGETYLLAFKGDVDAEDVQTYIHKLKKEFKSTNGNYYSYIRNQLATKYWLSLVDYDVVSY